ncbi:MAG: M23 family metallopeptidase, partial [Nitrospinota bacterium]
EGLRSYRGREIILRHSPEDTGLPVWTYTQYAHFDEMPKWEVGQRVRMGEILGPTGNSGRQGRRERRPAIHFAVWFSAEPRYVPLRRRVVPVGGFWMDPIALYRKGPPFDSRSMKALPEDGKQVLVSVMTKDGKVIPAGAKVVWPYFCERK